jgi:hypothetical protein
VAAAIFALAAATHGVSAVVATTGLAFYALAVVIVERAAWRRTVLTGLVILVLSLAGYAALLGLSGGDLGFQGVKSGAVADLPPNTDPARSFDRARLVPISDTNGSFFISPAKIVETYVRTTIDSSDHIGLGTLALALLAVATVLVVVVARRFVPLAVVAWGLAASFICAALLFSYRYDTQIPGDFGLRRLYDYASFTPALIVPAAIEVALARLLQRRPMALGAVAVAVAVLATVVSVDRIPDRDPGARAGLAEIGSLAQALPCDARILPNARSAGSWEALTGRRSVIEGLAPYLRPEVMAQVLPRLIEAREFLGDASAREGFLAQQNIDYVVVLKPRVLVGSLPPFRTRAGEIAGLKGTRIVYSSPRATVFAVGRGAMAANESYPRRCAL